MLDERNRVGPSTYKDLDKNREQQRKRILHGPSAKADNVSFIESQVFVKKEIPAPSKYESRGKDMHQLAKDKAEKFRYEYSKERGLDRTGKIKKNDVVGPTSYEVPQAVDQSAARKRSIKYLVPQAKNVNYIKSLLDQKAKVPGVGTYDNMESALR